MSRTRYDFWPRSPIVAKAFLPASEMRSHLRRSAPERSLLAGGAVAAAATFVFGAAASCGATFAAGAESVEPLSGFTLEVSGTGCGAGCETALCAGPVIEVLSTSVLPRAEYFI